MSKTFNQVKLNVNFTAISPSSNMSNIESDDNISSMFAKIHHWYVKTNGFQGSASPLVSTSANGIVSALPNTTGEFLKNTGTEGGTWTKLGDADIPDTIVRRTGNSTLSGLFEPTSNNSANLGRDNYRFQNIYGTHLFGTDFNGFTIEKSVPSDAVFTDTIPYLGIVSGPVGSNGVSNITVNEDGSIDVEKDEFLKEHPSITKQTDTTSTASPAHGGTFTVVDNVTRDTNGHVKKINTKTVTLPTLPTASTSTAGIVQLSSSTSSTSTSLAATPSAVKTAYDVGKSAKDHIDFENMVEIVNTTPYTYYSEDDSKLFIVIRFIANVIQDGATITNMGILINRRYNPVGGSPMPMALTLENYEIDHAQYETEDDGASILKFTISDSTSENDVITDSGKTATIGGNVTDKFGYGVHARPFVIFTYNGTTYTKYGIAEYSNYRTSFPMQQSTNSGKYFALAFGSISQSTAPTSDTTWPEYSIYPLYHNPKLYCKPSTGTIYATDLYSVNSSNGNVHLSEGGVKISLPASSSTGWNRALTFYTNNESTVLGRYGVYGSSNTLSYYYIGNTYSDTSHLVRVDNDGAGRMTLIGTLPQLKFRQTTSGSAYNNTNAGIMCYVADTSGMNMTIQSGGNMIIGGGEYPINFYNAMIAGNNTTSDLWAETSEKMYIGADHQVLIHTNAGTIGNRHTFTFGTDGSFATAPGGGLIIKRGTEASPVSHTLTTAATTTARTWTLPDKTGTVALTSDIGDFLSSDSVDSSGSSGTSGWYNCRLSGGKIQYYNTNTTYTTTSSVTSGSSALVTSGGVYSALSSKVNSSSLGDAAYKNYTSSVTSGSSNLVTSGAVYTALASCVQDAGNLGSSVDLNNYTSTQFFKLTSSKNGPSNTTYGICLVLHSGNYTAQLFVAYLTTDKKQHLFVRFYTGSSWGAWIQCG